MSRRRPNNKNNEYTDVPNDEVDSAEYDSFERNENGSKRIPYKTLAFILMFFIMGTVCDFFTKVYTLF